MAPARRFGQQRTHLVIIGIVAAILSLSVCIALIAVFASQQLADGPPTLHVDRLPPSSAIYRQYAVSSEAAECAEVGKELLERGGSAVDAAIAATLCGGLHHPQSAGIGGGSFMTVYSEKNRQGEVIDFRETAPKYSSPDMYKNNITLATYGGLSAAIPGEIAGYRAAWKKYGRLDWSTLFNRTIAICERGVPVNKYTAESLKDLASVIGHSVPFREEFLHGGGWAPRSAGQIVHRRRLCRTLRTIVTEPDSFYNGSLALDIVADVNEAGGNWTIEDLNDYTVKFRNVVRLHVDAYNFTVLAPPPPSVAALLGLVINVVGGYGVSASSISSERKAVHNTSITLQRVVEAFKYAFAQRALFSESMNATILGNLSSAKYAASIRSRILDGRTFKDSRHYDSAGDAPQDSGTLHTSVVDGHGMAVAITSTINTQFGSKVMGSRTGIIFNNEMDDFATSASASNFFGLAPSEGNRIQPGRRPLSSMCPSIVVDGAGRTRLVVGAGGGPRIVTATAWTIMNHLLFDQPIVDSVDRPRLHHQLLPDILNYEEGIAKEYRDELAARGHSLVEYKGRRPGFVQAIARVQGQWHAVSDARKRGGTAGL